MKVNRDAILQKLGLSSLNEMQLQVISEFRHHDSVMLLAPTGSGKTLAYLFPLIEYLAENKQAKAMIIVPARELALQIEQVVIKMGTGITVTSCYGGRKTETEVNNLKSNPGIVIGTPGRIADHIRRGNINPEDFKFLVIDEYDKALELGFLGEMSGILEALKQIKLSFLVSATEAVEPPDFPVFSKLHIENHLQTAIPDLKYYRFNSAEKDKLAALLELLHKTAGRKTIIFSNHRESVDRIQEFLKKKSVKAANYHGAIEQAKREFSIFSFRSGCTNILNTTDLASRGLDIIDVQYIIHYHLPLRKDIFIHRNGRSARMNADGSVILLLGPDEEIPAYLKTDVDNFEIRSMPAIKDTGWVTVFIGAGKKEKLNKVDIVGFFIKEGKLKSDSIGLIEVKDHHSFVAVKTNAAENLLKNIRGKKIKKLNPKIALAR